MEITFGGHSFFAITSGNKVAFIDPWIDNPHCPDSLKNVKPDLILLTHGHSDHSSNVISLANKYDCPVVCIVELAWLLKQAGLNSDLAVELNKGGLVEISGFKVSLTHALHSNSFIINDEPKYAGEACGFVVEAENMAVYHAGDTAIFSDMDWINFKWSPKVAMLPIGDVYTMGVEDAAEAAHLVQADITIPMHYGTFPVLKGKPEEFVDLCKKEEISTTVKVLKPGETLSLSEA